MELAKQKCEPPKEGMPPLREEEARELLGQVPGWKLKDKAIEREFEFKGFREAIGFVNRVAEVAEQEQHHPDICVSYAEVRLDLSTHKIGGLSRNDFIMAAKVNELV
jgi:4a-hydroxytetrahydrobiopterin dehydratase